MSKPTTHLKVLLANCGYDTNAAGSGEEEHRGVPMILTKKRRAQIENANTPDASSNHLTAPTLCKHLPTTHLSVSYISLLRASAYDVNTLYCGFIEV